MNINGINSLTNALPSMPASDAVKGIAGAAGDSSLSFGSTIKEMIASVNKQQIGAGHEVARVVAGDAPDLHRTIATLQAADLSFQLALQVRNKLIGAYEEIMRMQV
jgi:flagellar hook-basal body complex protein FliE